MPSYYERAQGFVRAYWPAIGAGGAALAAIVAGLIAMPSDREAADALEHSFLSYKAIPYRLRDADNRPADPETVLPLVDAYIRNGQQSKALEVLETYLQGNPGDLGAFYRAARLADWENLPHEAARYRFEIVRLDPRGEDPRAEDFEGTLRWLGGYLVWQRRVSEAADVYLNLARLDNEQADAVLRAGDVLIWAGRFDEASELLEQAVDTSPERIEAYVRLGRVYGWLGKDAEAISVYERAVQVNADSLGVWFELARLYQVTRQPDKLAQAIEEIRRLQ